jgi:hypothetical protein
MANPRIYYPIHAIGFSKVGLPITSVTGNFIAAKGVQSLGTTTSFNLEQVYQLGQLDLYENIENIPEIELTLEKVIDGYSLIQHLATPTAVASSLAGRFNDTQCQALIAYYDITQESASGTPLDYVFLSGLFVSAISWNIPVEGNTTENVTLTCRDKRWNPAGALTGTPFSTGRSLVTASGRLPGLFNNAESPILASGGVQRRENIVMGSGNSKWPRDIPGVDQINGFNLYAAGSGTFGAHIQNVTINVSLGREDLFELGQRNPYFRYATFPTEVTASIEITSTEDGDTVEASSTTDNLTDEAIRIVMTNGVIIDLGTKNKLASVDDTGGDTGGANRTITFNYSNFNSYKALFPVADPAGLSV